LGVRRGVSRRGPAPGRRGPDPAPRGPPRTPGAGLYPAALGDDGALLNNGSSCTVVLPQLAPGNVLLYEFGVLPAIEMSLIVVVRARGGDVRM
jgi:hypothetical protein